MKNNLWKYLLSVVLVCVASTVATSRYLDIITTIVN